MSCDLDDTTLCNHGLLPRQPVMQVMDAVFSPDTAMYCRLIINH